MTRGGRLALIALVLLVPRAGADAGPADAWAAHLGSPQRSVREAATERLVDLGPGGWLQLERLIRHPQPRIRAAACDALPRLPDVARAFTSIRRLLRDPDATVRSAAVRALLIGVSPPLISPSGQATPKHQGIEVLRAEMNRDPRLGVPLMPSVQRWSNLLVHATLQALLKHQSGYYDEMYEGVTQLRSWARQPLLALFTQPPADQRLDTLQRMAGDALGDLGDRSVIPELVSMYRRSRYPERVQETCAVALYKLGAQSYALTRVRTYRSQSRFNQRRLWQLAYFYQRLRLYSESIEVYRQLLRQSREYTTLSHYNLACAYSKLKRKEHGLYHLQQALQNGYDSIEWIHRDRDLDFLRPDPRFPKILASPRTPQRFDLDSERRR